MEVTIPRMYRKTGATTYTEIGEVVPGVNSRLTDLEQEQVPRIDERVTDLEQEQVPRLDERVTDLAEIVSANQQALQLSALKQTLLDVIYPVGSIYMSANNVSPATFFGGTWEALDDGRVLIGANSTYKAGSTGGEFTHKLTSAELASHNHSASTNSTGSHAHTVTAADGGAHTHSGSIGSAGSHTHQPGSKTAFVYYKASTSSDRNNFTYSSLFNYEHYISRSDNSSLYPTSLTSTGAHTHTISTNSGGAHTHTMSLTSTGNHTHTVTVNSTGSGTAHNNMQPYLAVYMWKRTA